MDFSKLESKSKVTIDKPNGFGEEEPEFDELIEKGKQKYQKQQKEYIRRALQGMKDLYRKGGARTKTHRWREFLQTKEFLSVQYEPDFIELLIRFLQMHGKIPDSAWAEIVKAYFLNPDNLIEYKLGYGELYEYLVFNGNGGGFRKFYERKEERKEKLRKIQLGLLLTLPIVLEIMLRYKLWFPALIAFMPILYFLCICYAKDKTALRIAIFIEALLILVFAYAFDLPDLVIRSEFVVGTILIILLFMFLYGRKHKVVWMMLLAFLGLLPSLIFLICYFIQDYIDIGVARLLMPLVLFCVVYISNTNILRESTLGERLEGFGFSALKVLGAICVVSFIIRTAANEPNYYAFQDEPHFDVVAANKKIKANSTEEMLQERLGDDWDIVTLLDDKEYKIIPTDEKLIEELVLYVTGDSSGATFSEFWNDFTAQLTNLSIVVELNMGPNYALKVVSPYETEDIWFVVMDGVVTYNVADEVWE